MKKGTYYIGGLESSICGKMLEELRYRPSNVRYNLIDTRRTAAAKGRSQRALMQQAKPRQSMNSKASKKKLSPFMLFFDTSSTIQSI